MQRDPSSLIVERVDARSNDALASMQSYFDELSIRFPTGFDSGDTLIDDAASFDPPTGGFLLLRKDADAVAGCGGVHYLADDCAEIKRMWIHPDWRGLGLGKLMLLELEQHAAQLGYQRVRLDTNSVLVEAIAMYERAGYEQIPAYNDNPFAERWFEKALGEAG